MYLQIIKARSLHALTNVIFVQIISDCGRQHLYSLCCSPLLLANCAGQLYGKVSENLKIGVTLALISRRHASLSG